MDLRKKRKEIKVDFIKVWKFFEDVYQSQKYMKSESEGFIIVKSIGVILVVLVIY